MRGRPETKTPPNLAFEQNKPLQSIPRGGKRAAPLTQLTRYYDPVLPLAPLLQAFPFSRQHPTTLELQQRRKEGIPHHRQEKRATKPSITARTQHAHNKQQFSFNATSTTEKKTLYMYINIYIWLTNTVERKWRPFRWRHAWHPGLFPSIRPLVAKQKPIRTRF